MTEQRHKKTFLILYYFFRVKVHHFKMESVNFTLRRFTFIRKKSGNSCGVSYITTKRRVLFLLVSLKHKTRLFVAFPGPPHICVVQLMIIQLVLPRFSSPFYSYVVNGINRNVYVFRPCSHHQYSKNKQKNNYQCYVCNYIYT